MGGSQPWSHSRGNDQEAFPWANSTLFLSVSMSLHLGHILPFPGQGGSDTLAVPSLLSRLSVTTVIYSWAMATVTKYYRFGWRATFMSYSYEQRGSSFGFSCGFFPWHIDAHSFIIHTSGVLSFHLITRLEM